MLTADHVVPTGPPAAPVALNQRKPHSAFPGSRPPSGQPAAAAAAAIAEEEPIALLQSSTRKESRLRHMHFKGEVSAIPW